MPSGGLTLANLLPYLERKVDDLVHWQIADPAHPDYGALVSADYGMPWGQLAGGFITGCAYRFLGALAVGDERRIAAARALLPAAVLAADAMMRAQRPSGLLDLITVNYDSSPDTGFTVQQLCTVIELGRVMMSNMADTGAKPVEAPFNQLRARVLEDPAWTTLTDKIEQFIRRAVPGMMDGGFHTPNHRWVIAAALAQAARLFPELDVPEETGHSMRRTVDAYLAEGADIDAEGFFIERSVGVYDAVNDRSLLLIAEHYGWPGALEAVERNLNLDLRLLHADGTSETGLSRRQDYGTREVALGLAPCLLLYHGLRPNPTFSRAAQWLWEQAPQPGPLEWLLYPLLKYGDPVPADAALPDDFTLSLPRNGMCRVRRGLLSATVFRDATRLLSLVFGSAELTSLKISMTYFGAECGRFIGDALAVEGGRTTLRSEGRRRPRRPGYELPLGRPVPPERWVEMTAERELRRLPPLLGTLELGEAADRAGHGFDLRFRTLDGLDKVATQIALDFPPGGVWETDDTRTKPMAGQVLFLKQGHGAMRYGSDVIRIGPGAMAHGMWQMRDAEPAPNHVRVLLTFLTPVDFTFTLRAHRGLGAGHVDTFTRSNV